MRREISEQPVVLGKTVDKIASISNAIDHLSIRKFSRIIFIARGTSDNVAAYGIFLAPILSGLETFSISPSLLNSYSVNFDLAGALVFAISQSGQTEEIVGAARKAKQMGAVVIGITNNEQSKLEAEVDFCFVTPAGAEIAVPATKTYTSALLAVAGTLGVLFEHHELMSEIKKVPRIAFDQVSNTEINEAIIRLIAESSATVFAGRGLAMGSALEAALKLKETCGINAIGTSVADLVHGPIAALSKSVPLVVLSSNPNSPIYSGLVDLITKARILRSPVITLGDFDQKDKSELHISIGISGFYELLSPLALAIPSQLIAASVADFKNLNADSPIGLNKVTQTV